jgi:hypothetical protein
MARLTAHHVEAGVQAARRALATARADLGDVLPPEAVREVLDAVEAEEARLVAARRAVSLVEDALRGRRYVPRL